MPDPVRIVRSRFRALLLLREQSCSAFAVAIGLSATYVERVVAGRMPLSERVAGAIQEQLGEQGWAFVTGRTDTLQAPSPARPKRKSAA